jgi:hypothetical protein
LNETICTKLVGKFADLRLGALIAPDERWADQLIVAAATALPKRCHEPENQALR